MKYFLFLLMLTSCVHTDAIRVGDYVKVRGFYQDCCVRAISKSEPYALPESYDTLYTGVIKCSIDGNEHVTAIKFTESEIISSSETGCVR